MTVCIVAQFPWRAITSVTQSEPAGAIICTDTRVTAKISPRKFEIQPDWYAKQRNLNNNIYVCYTSSNLSATTKALDRVNNTRSLRKVGEALKSVHGELGGYTELIAVVVGRKSDPPQILELIPPVYKPKQRHGVIGIGDQCVRDSFRRNFFHEPRPDLVDPAVAEVRARLGLQPPTYAIHEAAGNVAQALASAIEHCHSPTVGIPIQTTSISEREIKSFTIFSSANDGRTWEKISAGPREVKIPRFRPVKVYKPIPQSTAEQLFD